jgi:hypothetical protein
VAISEVELRDKVGKLMAMAGTEGGAYAMWTVNQIVHGLKNVAPGVRPEGVDLALKQLERFGVVKCVDPGEPGKKAARWVRVVKIETPEHMERSPFEEVMRVQADMLFGCDTSGQKEVVVGPKESEKREPQRMGSAEASATGSAEGDALSSRIEGIEAVVRSVVQRADNMEEVMQTLNNLVGTMQEHFKNKLRADKESANRFKFDAADYRRLERRVDRIERQSEERVTILEEILGMAAKEVTKQGEEDVVGVVAVDGRDRAKALKEVEELAHEWLAGGDSSMAADLAKRGCGATIIQLLSRHGVLTDDVNLCGD